MVCLLQGQYVFKLQTYILKSVSGICGVEEGRGDVEDRSLLVSRDECWETIEGYCIEPMHHAFSQYVLRG